MFTKLFSRKKDVQLKPPFFIVISEGGLKISAKMNGVPRPIVENKYPTKFVYEVDEQHYKFAQVGDWT